MGIFRAHSSTLLKHLLKRQRIVRANGVVDSYLSPLDHLNCPCGEIADINKLDGTISAIWSEDFAALSETTGPVGKTTRTVSGSNNQSWTDNQSVVGENVLHDLFTE